MYSSFTTFTLVLLFCTASLATDQCSGTCASNQVCVNLGQGYQCAYRQCSDITCAAGEICMNNGGVARCISTSNAVPASTSAPTAAPTSAPTSAPTVAADPCHNECTSTTQVCVNLGAGYQCQPRSCSDLSCDPSNQVCINDGGVARCINTSRPASASTSCNVAVTIVARNGGYYVNNGVEEQIYDLTFANTGSSAVSALSISITPSGNAAIQSGNYWNLAATGTNAYSVSLYGSLSAAGSQYYGSGFVLSGPNCKTVPLTVASPTC